LPFEPDFYARHGLAASFVGHPVLESGADRGNAARFRASRALEPDTKLITLMPGSRPSEVARLLPIFGHALGLLADRVPGLVPAVPVAPNVAGAVEQAAASWPIRPLIVSELADKHDCFAASAVALTKSGTSTLELALAGVPMAVAYRVNPITAAVVRRLVKIRYASIMNLLADREIVPELLQENCTPERLAATLAPLLMSASAAEKQRQDFRDVLARLAVPDVLPSDAAAGAVLAMLDQAGRFHPRA
jgi:lipid-A-disaccharide synthase